jgi:hypothetical protein
VADQACANLRERRRLPKRPKIFAPIATRIVQGLAVVNGARASQPRNITDSCAR